MTDCKPHKKENMAADSDCDESSMASGGSVLSSEEDTGRAFHESGIPRRVSVENLWSNDTNGEMCDADAATGNDGQPPSSNSVERTMLARTTREASFRAECFPRDALIDSITWLGRHVPDCVLSTCIEEIRNNPGDSQESDALERDDKMTDAFGENDTLPISTADEMLPYASRHEAALLFVDISGFTRLSTQMDVESLSKVINGYFQMLVNEVRSYGGDILKFAGDAFFAEWRATRGKPLGNASFFEERRRDDQCQSIRDIGTCVTMAAQCGASIVEKFSDCPVFYPEDSQAQISTLNVHCGLGVGDLGAGHFGNSSRREFLIFGEPIDQVASAEGRAGHGELWASPPFIQILSKDRDIENDIKALAAEGRPALLAARSKMYFGKVESALSNTKCAPQRASSDSIADRCRDMSISSLVSLRQCISIYVHPVIVADDPSSLSKRESMVGRRGSMVRKRSSIGLGASAQKRHLAEAELRSVFTMFISPSIDVKIGDNEEANMHMVNILNDVIVIVTSELDRHGGHLRQFIVDDKGVVLIANFGLRGSTYPRMVEERALPAARSIHYSLEIDLGIENTIGCTLGDAYCGVVGGLERHEFAVLGPSVNLSARLMTASENRGILVDNSVRLKAGKEFSFDPLTPVKAKGYGNPVLIFEPLTSKERRWGKVDRNFVGRDEELNAIVDAVVEIADSETKKASAFIRVSGHGKSTLLVQAIAMARKIIRFQRKHIIVTRNIGKEGDTIVPFSIFRSIFLDVLAEIESVDREGSVASSRGPLRSVAGSVSQMSHLSSASTYNESLNSDKLKSAVERLQYLAEELNAPPEFMVVVGQHLLGLQPEKASNEKEFAGSKLTLDAIVDFMAKAFILCTSHADVVVLTLDDVQHLDDLSWRVVQTIHQQGENLLILCASRDADGGLADKLGWVSRHQEIVIPPLTIDETKKLIAKMLGHDETDIDPNLARNVHMQCNGIPAFVVEVIKNMKKGDLVARGEGGIVGLKNSHQSASQSSLDDLILHQIDLLNASVRSILQIAATLGIEFCLSDVVEVAVQMDQVEQEERPEFHQDLLDALVVAAEEGILRQIFEGQESNTHERDSGDPEESISQVLSTSVAQSTGLGENRIYAFAHAVWRDNILKVLLESRKKEIHFNVALALESKEKTKIDLYSHLRLFRHRKESGDWSKASESALDIGKVLENIGLHEQAIDVLKEALSFWRIDPKTAAEDASRSREEANVNSDKFGGVVSPSAIESASAGEIESIVRLLISLGKVLANIVKGKESAAMYDAAITIIHSGPASRNLKDRTFIFPCFSGLFVSLKFGDIEDDENCTYEKELVKTFVTQAKLNGDPIHYTRALAMQGETYGRLGEYDKAFAAHRKLESIYDPDKHSAGVCKAYGSDRSAQSFAHSTRWKMMIGDPCGALKTCRYIVEVLMPKMEERNVHNSCMMLWPVLWVMKDMGLALEARDHFDALVVQAFQKHFGEGGSTWALPAYKPTLTLLDLAGHQDDENMDQDRLAEYKAWAVDLANMEFSSGLNGGMSAFSRDLDSIAAEICLLLAKRTKSDDATRKVLVHNGLVLAEKSFDRCRKKIAAFGQIRPIYEELKQIK